MKKVVTRIILTMLILAMAISVFVACEFKENNVTFIDVDDTAYATLPSAEARDYMTKNQPTKEGYVFMGWYLDKDVWTQKVEPEDIEKYTESGNVNVYAKWAPIEQTFIITYYDYNNAILGAEQYERSQADNINWNLFTPTYQYSDKKYSYTFETWECDMSDLTKAAYYAIPKYTSDYRYFDVRYYDQNDKLIRTDKVKYGENANTSRTLTDYSDEKYTYKFTGWDGNATNVTSDINLTAHYEKSLIWYKVTFKYGDGSTKIEDVSYGTDATSLADKIDTQKKDTAQYRYIFRGWKNENDNQTYKNVTSDMVVNAIYEEQLQIYEVSFWAGDKRVQTTNEPYGTIISEIVPTSEPVMPDDGFIYTFKGWKITSDKVTGVTNIYADFDKQSQTFEVKYYDWNGELLYTTQVESGEEAIYPYDNPTKESSAMYDYTYKGWYMGEQSADAKLKAVSSNMSVYAKFDESDRLYCVTFKYGDNYSKEEKYYNTYGKSVSAPTSNLEMTDTAQFKYRFIGWENELYKNIQSDMVIKAVYDKQIQQYEVSFWISEDSDDVKDCIKSSFVNYGESAVAPTKVVKNADDGFSYTFLNWDKSFDNIQADTRVNAVFNKQSQTFEITYEEWNGEILYTERVETGETSTYKGTKIPHRESNPQFEYEFIGWSNEEKLDYVTETIAVRAQYSEKIRTYTVTFDYGYENRTVVMENVPYGTNLLGQEPTETSRESTVANHFSFLGWMGDLGYIYQDTTITARWAETLRKYLVKFVINGITVSEQEVGYGYCPTRPNISGMASTPKFEYLALGWGISDGNFKEGQFVDFDDEDYDENNFVGIDVENTQVNEDTLVGEQIVYAAIYLRTIREYFVTFINEQILGTKIEVAKIKVKYGSDVTSLAPIVTRDMTQSQVYTFVNWSGDLTNITSDIKVEAEYSWEWRKYLVTYYYDVSTDDTVQYAEYYSEEVEYNKGVQNKPEIPQSKWTVGFEYKFARWGAGEDDNYYSDVDHVFGDTAVYAQYDDLRRKYRVTFFDLSVYELISTTELYYEEKIDRIIEREGYDFDAWYRDPDCTTMFNQDTEFVDGIMMLFGNTVISGLKYEQGTIGTWPNRKTAGVVTGYEGELAEVILPRVIKGLPMAKVASEAFANNKVMESIYIPNCYSDVEAYIFKDIKELDIYTEAVNGAGLDYPYGWNPYWNNNNAWPGTNDSRVVTNNVENVVTQGDYRYMLIGGGNTAIISKFVNNNAARAYIQSTLGYQNPSFEKVTHVDEHTKQEREIYTINTTEKTYSITTIANSAFSGCANLGSVFIPSTISSVKKYAFSGITVNLYIQRERPKALGVENDLPSGWNVNWNSNRSGDEGERKLYWGVIGMDEVGKFTYIFKNDGSAIAAEFNGGSLSLVGTIEMPDTVEYRSPEDANVMINYTVTELGDSLFEASLVSLGNVSNVKLPSGLEKIGKKVFYMNKTLKSITLPSGVKEIGDYAFTGTSALEEVFVPAAIEKFGAFCFAGSSATIYIARSKPLLPTSKPTRGAYWNARVNMTDITDLDVSKIAGMIFGTQTLPTYWEVDSRYTDVATGTLTKTNFLYILRSNGTAYLAGYSSAGMAHVTSYSIPTTIEVDGKVYNVTEIGEEALSGNTALKTLYVPASITTVGANAFSGCKNLTVETAHASKPSGWDDSCDADIKGINWGIAQASTEETE